MPSPFPGMDPFIEGRSWSNFHFRMIAAIADQILPQIRPRYAVLVEERVYLEHSGESAGHIRPDVTVIDDGSVVFARPAAGNPTTIAPVVLTLPMPEEVIEHFLTIRDLRSNDVVTIIEVLSPTNKRSSSDGLAKYLAKREEVLTSRTNLVEIDLLRGGARPPTREPLPAGDYFIFISRTDQRPKVDVYPVRLKDTLPMVGIPLSRGDADVELNLQLAFKDAYDRAGYDYVLDYTAEVIPPLSDDDEAWAREILKSRATE